MLDRHAFTSIAATAVGKCSLGLPVVVHSGGLRRQERTQSGRYGEQRSDPTVDFAARGPVVKGNYGTLTGNTRPQAEVFNGTAPAATATAGLSGSDDRVRTADASGDVVPAGNGGYQLNFENADVGAVSKAILGDILKSNYLVDKRVAGQITLTSSQPVPRARLVPLLESALAGLGATVVKDQDLYRVVPSADPGGIGAVDSHGEGEGFGTSVITAKYMPAANLAHLLEGFGSRPGSVKSDPGTNLVIIQGTASERRAAIDAAGLVDVDWLRSKSVAILPVCEFLPRNGDRRGQSHPRQWRGRHHPRAPSNSSR